MPEEQRLRLIVYIDNYNLRPFNRNRVMRELRAFIGTKLQKDDQLMLVTYDRELHIRRTFTSDPSLIAAAMLDLEKISAQGVHADSDRRDVLKRDRGIAERRRGGDGRPQLRPVHLQRPVVLDRLDQEDDRRPGRHAGAQGGALRQRRPADDRRPGCLLCRAGQVQRAEHEHDVVAGVQRLPPARRADGAGQRQPDHLLHDRRRAGCAPTTPTRPRTRGRAPAPLPGVAQLVDSVRISNLQGRSRSWPRRRAASPSSTPT